MYRDPNSSSASGTSTKGDEVEIVSRFLAPLCARDETARNIALAAARNTVEGWLGGVGSPNHWDDTGEMEDAENLAGMFKSQDGRYDMSVERSPTKSAPKNVHQPPHQQQLLQDMFRTEGFFPQSVTENPPFLEDSSLECTERYPSGSFDCVDGRLGNETGYGTPNERRRYDLESYRSGHSTSSDEGKGFKIEQDRYLRFKDGSETRFGSSSESERKFIGSSSSERLNETSLEGRPRATNYVKVKGAKQKQLEDDELDSDTRIYGKSPKFDDNLAANFDRRNLNYRQIGGDVLSRDRRCYDSGDDVSFDETEIAIRNCDGVVFNTLDGFENENANEIYHRQPDDNRAEDMKLQNFEIFAREDEHLDDGRQRCVRSDQPQDYLRKNDERKFSGGQIKRPLSQDEDVSFKSGRVLESPDVTPGDVGRMLNLGNALDGPRQAQANKYLSLVTLHLPVILRLSVNCPFQNVRIKCAEILEMVKDRGLPVPMPAFDGPSAFVPTFEDIELALIAPISFALRLVVVGKIESHDWLRGGRCHGLVHIYLSPGCEASRYEEGRDVVRIEKIDSRYATRTDRGMSMPRMLHQEPGWKIERKGSALLLRRDSSHPKTSRVYFRCDVEVREFERDEDYALEAEPEAAASPLAMCASCLAALCVTVILPWLLIGG